MTIFTIHDYSVLFGILSLGLSLAALVVGLDCVWRAEKRLETFMVLLTCSLAPFMFREFLQIFGYHNATIVNFYYILDAVSMFLLLTAFVEMYKIIRTLDNENPKRSDPSAAPNTNQTEKENAPK